jgi:hypothetical protein
MQIFQAIRKRARRARPVGGIVAGDGAEEHGVVLDGAGERPDVIEHTIATAIACCPPVGPRAQRPRSAA